jgi:putative isomerase
MRIRLKQALLLSIILLPLFGAQAKDGKPLQFSLGTAPFSVPDSGISVCDHSRSGGLVITDVRYTYFGKRSTLIKLYYENESNPTKPQTIGTPGELQLYFNDQLDGRICFESYKKLRLAGKTQPLILCLDGNLIANGTMVITPQEDNTFHIQRKNRFGESFHQLRCLQGSLVYEEANHRFILKPSEKKGYEICLEELGDAGTPSKEDKAFADCVSAMRDSYNDFLSKCPKLPEKYEGARQLAAYILWSSRIDHGYYKRPGMLMSKNWMHYIWSWDHCFNAIACAYHMPQESWDNLMVVFDGQLENGQLPNRYGYVQGTTDYRYRKPPIHGWALTKMRRHVTLSDSQLREIYSGLKQWTNYWFNEWDVNKNGIPEYLHGYDSGWDNGTTFDRNIKDLHGNRESADLSAYLTVQMDVLHDLALELGLPDEAAEWKKRSDQQLKLLLENLWDGESFVTRVVEDGYINKTSESLMQFLPLILGEKLPNEIREKMIDKLKNGGFITQWGLASESVNSPLHSVDSYWRGPIWAPSTMIVIEGVDRCGEHELAKDIARRFSDLCAAHGFAENFDAKTGQGHRDLGYTWTASVFLTLAHDYLSESE